MAAWSVQNLTNFVTSFTVPYLMDPGYGNLGARVGLIYGGFGIIACIWAYMFYPELKGRSLDEVDLVFDQNIVPEKTLEHVTEHIEKL